MKFEVIDSPKDNRPLKEKEANWRANACREECRDNIELAARSLNVNAIVVRKWRLRYMRELEYYRSKTIDDPTSEIPY